MNAITIMRPCLAILLFVSSAISIVAQNNYYYHLGKKIPLTTNAQKVCVSIPKDKAETTKFILSKTEEQGIIQDNRFDIYIIQKDELDKLAKTDDWKRYKDNALITPVYITETGAEVFSTPYLNVRLKNEQDVQLLESYSKKYGLEITKKVPLMPLWYILSLSSLSDKNAMDVANALWESGNFAAAVPDLSADGIAFCANDPEFGNQWGLYNGEYPGIDISACDAWNISTGRGVKVAIIDGGIEKSHQDLCDNILSNLSYNTDTGSSYYLDVDDHATHCAGIVAAVKDNEMGIAGVAPDSKIMPIFCDMYKASTNLQVDMASGIMWAYQNGADVISCSWGFPTRNSAIEEAIHHAFSYGRNGKGCVITFAVGNSGDSIISYPANCNDTILAVGAIMRTGSKANFSQYGNGLDLVAPGSGIKSTIVNNRYYNMNGTSMACPHVAGVAALVLERDPELTVTQVNSIICRNAKKLTGVNFNTNNPDGTWNEMFGYGLVDAYSSVLNTPSAVYIQNEIITGTEMISADSIYVGRNVTDRKQQGNVVLGPGDITLNASKVTIKNSTTVPLGTALRIGNTTTNEH